MILSAHQPAYLPWLGLFHKAALSDTFCVVDSVAYSRGDFINRNRIKSANGVHWLTVPVRTAGAGSPRICDVRIFGTGWARKHAAAIAQSYARAPYFADYAPEIQGALLRPHVFFTDLTMELLRIFWRILGLRASLVRASDYDIRGAKSDFVLDMCVKLGARTFVFGEQGASYANVEAFRSAGIDVLFQNYVHPVYAQSFGSFVPMLSVIDLIFHEGPRSLDVLMSGNLRDASAAARPLRATVYDECKV